MKVPTKEFVVNFRLTEAEFEAAEELRLALNMGRSQFWRFLLANMRAKMQKVVLGKPPQQK